jgi:hypothetical protein
MAIGWSFCIVTAAGNETQLLHVLDSIDSEFKSQDNYEIIVVGNTAANIINKYPNIELISFNEKVFAPSLKSIKNGIRSRNLKKLLFRTGAICHKKNIAARRSKYDKLCIMHDYVGLTPGWLEGWNLFGSEWEVAMNILQNMDETRHKDWLNLDYPGVSDSSDIWDGACLQPYETTTDYMYVPGMYFCVKRKFFLRHLLNENLFWNEGEDIEWSLRVRSITKFHMNKNSVSRYVKQKYVDWELWHKNENKFLALIQDQTSQLSS